MVHNYMEDLVEEFLGQVLDSEQYADICKCARCQDDIRAYALNHLKPFYITGTKGMVYGKYSVKDTQIRMDIVQELTRAITVVSQNKHDDPKG